MIIKFNLNNQYIEIDVNQAARLSSVLRDNFGLLSTKESCLCGECGCCTVLLDNEPVPSCVIPIFTVTDKTIVTLEHFQKTENYEIIRKSLKSANCNLCRYCMQGRFLVIHYIIQKNRELSDNDIYESLSGNRCECTDFKSLKKGIKMAFLTIRRKEKAGKTFFSSSSNMRRTYADENS